MREHVATFGIDTLAFLDETGLHERERRNGWYEKGKKAIGFGNFGTQNKYNMIVIFSSQGILQYSLDQATVNTEEYGFFMLACLPQIINQGIKMIVMDNLSVHHACDQGVHQLYQVCGITICYLPSYSPDLNPIENVFKVLKDILMDSILSPYVIRLAIQVFNAYQDSINYVNKLL